jgi:hypothetical protein
MISKIKTISRQLGVNFGQIVNQLSGIFFIFCHLQFSMTIVANCTRMCVRPERVQIQENEVVKIF